MLGSMISHYKILEKLGEGGMGVVYKALDVKLDRSVALKLLPPRAIITDDDRARFANEARAAARLSHPHIATIYEFGESEGHAFLAMELIEGQDLRKKIQGGSLDVAEVLSIASTAAAGLAAAHERGIVHRDMKSENIMLTSDGSVKIMDFGLAQVQGHTRLWRSGETLGTVSYMSPEQARGETLDLRTDIWSLGVVLYEMLTARLPFPGDYGSAILYLIMHEPPQPIRTWRDDVPAKLQEIVSRCLEKEAGRRYQKATELLSDLTALQKRLERGVETPHEKPAEQKRFETERRPVTVLHAAIVSDDVEELDPETLTAGLDECIDGLISIIKKYEGMTDRILGDRLMAVFGAPLAHENDPERAVRCAHEMMAYVGRINAMAISEFSRSFRLKIGIHSGVVVAGTVGAEKGYSVVGDTVNIAAGITDLADAGRILLSAETMKQVSDLVEAEEPRLFPVKGKGHEVKVQTLRSLKGGREPGRRAVGTGAFVGRAGEIALFEESLGRVQKRGEVRIFVQGEAGVGKTRLKDELASHARRRGMPVCEGRCSSFEVHTPYYLWNTLLRSMLRSDLETPEPELRSRLHELVRALSLESEEPYLATLLSLRYEEILLEEDEQRKTKIYEATRNVLRSYAQRKPTVFLFEDLHWIDRFSQNLLEFILGEQELGPALTVCLHRPEYRKAGDISRGCERIDLNRLPTEEARELMRLRLGAESLPERLESLIEQRSEGNPFFIEEIIKTLLEKGIVDVKENKLEVKYDKLEAGVPETLQGVILARIDQLEDKIREILLDASVIGREFSRSVLEHIVQKKLDVAGGLKKLESVELVFEKEEAQELEYLFKHYLIQEVAYNTILQKKRRQLHALIARAIEALYSDRLKEFYEILAFHYEKAEDWVKAADFLSRAGNKARETFTKEESNDFVERTDAAKAMLLQGKGTKSRMLLFYRIVFGVIILGWFANAVAFLAMLIFSTKEDPLWVIAIGAFFVLFFLSIALYGGFYLFQILRPRARAFSLFDDRIELILSSGASFAIPFSEVSFFHFFERRGTIARSLWSYVASASRDASYSLRAGVKMISQRLNPTSFGFGAKKGEIHLRKKTGLTFISLETFFRPWKFILSAQRDVALTPTEPAEFYDQLTVAYERWRRKVGGGRRTATMSDNARQGRPSEDMPLLTLQPAYGFLSTLVSLNYNWYLLLMLMVFQFILLTIARLNHPELTYARLYTEPSGVFLISVFAFLAFLLGVYLTARKRRQWTGNRYVFYQDRFTFHLVEGTPAEGCVNYDYFADIEALGKWYRRLFKRGDVILRTNKAVQVHPALGLAEAALILPDIPNPEAAVRSVGEVVEQYRAGREKDGNSHDE